MLFSPSHVEAYHNGSFMGEVNTTNPSIIYTQNVIRFGANSNPAFNDNYVLGVMDDIRFYNRKLTTDEVSELAAQTP